MTDETKLSALIEALKLVKGICGPTGWSPGQEHPYTFRNQREKTIYYMIERLEHDHSLLE